MASIEPAAIVVLPLVVVAAMRRRWAFLLVVGSVPFFGLEVFVAVSHRFRLPELAILVFIGHYAVAWIRRERVDLRNATPVLLLWGFVGVSTVSVVALALHPPEVPVHPYVGTFQSRRFVDLSISSKNVTQLLLRGLFVAAVTVLAVHLDERRIREAVRGVVLGAAFVGVVGVGYQVAVMGNATFVPETLRAFGFARFVDDPGMLGPIPRMYSTVGEPGFTADYLLYGFAIATTLAVVPGPDWAFRRWELFVLSPLLGGALLSSTGTTGYGGLVILASAFVAFLALFPDVRPRHFRWYVVTACVGGVLAVGVLFAILGPTLVDLVVVQVEKMTFQARSGTIRRFYILRSIVVFRARPIIGVGVGSHHAPSYLFTLLAETGIVGTTALIGAHLWAYRQCMGLVDAAPRVRRPAVALAIAGNTLLATNLVAKSISSLLMPWYWFGLALPIAVIANRRRSAGRAVDTSETNAGTRGKSTHS